MKAHLLIALALSAASVQAENIIPKGSPGWSYLHITDGTDPADAFPDADFQTTWFNPTTGGYVGGTYNGPTFTTGGTTPLHYGTLNGVGGGTVFSPLPSEGLRYTNYCYLVFDGGNGFTDLQLSMLSDDGAFVYLNGELIATDNVTAPDTYLKSADALGNESIYDDIPLIGNPVIKPGLNLLAVSLHQDNTSSSDLGFDLEFTGSPILTSTSSTGWAMLSPVNEGIGYDPASATNNPATADIDFNTTWLNQSLGSYVGGAYNGPAFATGLTGPFAYGGVDGIPDNGSPNYTPTPGTTIPQPDLGTRGSAYFLKDIDGGDVGYDNLRLKMLADDGAYVYLNGTHVATIGDLPTYSPSTDTWAQQTATFGNETTVHELVLSGTQLLHPGSNLLAISLHNTATTSSDLGFSLEMVPFDPVVPVVVRGPYLQSGAHDKMTIRWRTDQAGDSVVRYGDAPGNLTETVSMATSTTEHIVPITGLDSATTYYYEIETTSSGGTLSVGDTTDYSFKTYPAPGTKAPTRVWVIGDSGTANTNAQNVYNSYLARTGSAHTDVWLMLGDNAYNNGTDNEFQAAVFDTYPELLRKTVMWSCFGNHESYTASGQPYFDAHTFPENAESGGVASGSERYYSFDHGNIHFVCIDSQTSSNFNDVPGGGGMADWLELDLQATDKDWIIAYFHHGPYTKGSHNSDTEDQHIAIRRYITPLLEKYGCDLVLSGHSHCYERSMLINGHHSNMSSADSKSGTFTAANIVDGGNGSEVGSVDSSGTFLNSGADGAYQKPLAQGESGTIYSICGASGKLSSWTGGSSATVNPTPHPVFIVNLRVLGSLVLSINGNTLNAQYIDDTNTIRDDFTIVKGSTVSMNATDDTFGEIGSDDTATFTITRTGATSFAESIDVTIGGSTTNGVDFTPTLTTTVDFAADEVTKNVTLTRAADQLAEGPETVSLTITGAQQAAGTSGVQRDRYFVGTENTDTATLADAPSQDWWFNAFDAASLTSIDWDLDTDHDGLTRIQELAFGGTEGDDNSDLLPSGELSNGVLALHYVRDNSLTEFNYQVHATRDLTFLDSVTFTDTLDGAANPTGIEQRMASIPINGEARGFLKLSVDFAE